MKTNNQKINPCLEIDRRQDNLSLANKVGTKIVVIYMKDVNSKTSFLEAENILISTETHKLKQNIPQARPKTTEDNTKRPTSLNRPNI